MKKVLIRPWLRFIFGVGIAAVVAIQIVPYGHASAPADSQMEIHWNSPRTEELARRACYDCHSNETRRSWYSRIAPVSWFVQSNIERGRAHLNFSEWDRIQPHVFDAAGKLVSGQMPPYSYRLFNPEARLTVEEEKDLIDGIYATLGIRRVVRYDDLLSGGERSP